MSNRKYLTYPSNPLDWPASPQDLSGDQKDVPYLGIYTGETTQRYTLGTRYTTWDGRVFKYGLAEAAVVTGKGCRKYTGQACGWSALASTSLVGSYEAQIVTGATQQGTSVLGTTDSIFLKDALAGGYVCFFLAGDYAAPLTMGIVANDGLTTGGGTLKVYLDVPFYAEHTSSSIAEVMTSPYYNVKYHQTYLGSAIVGMPCIPASANDFFWMQTWGPCQVNAQSALSKNTGAIHAWGAVFRSDGTVDMHHNESAEGGAGYNVNQQHAGWAIITNTDGGQGAPFLMLHIST